MDQDWDIFCQVVDNYGDIGVCWRLACGLAEAGRRVRLFVDDASALAWMAPQGRTGVAVHAVRFALDGPSNDTGTALPGCTVYEVADVVVAAFGCTLPAPVVTAIQSAGRSAARRVEWIHLEYLSAEPYVESSHGLASPVLGGAPAGVHRRFYFPGFTPRSGGLLREPGLMARRRAFDRHAWLRSRGIDWNGEPVIGLFCYEPPLLEPWLAQAGDARALLLVAAGRGAQAVRMALSGMAPGWNAGAALRIAYLPPLAQDEFDHFLWAGDVNFVRGEDSLVRALWAGAGLVWQAYPQDGAAHRNKLDAFLDWLGAPAGLRDYTLRWNGLGAGPLPPLLEADGAGLASAAASWTAAVQAARARLLQQEDLVTRMLRFAAENR